MKTANILYIGLLCIVLFFISGLAEANTAPITNGTIPDQTVTDLIATTVDVSTYFSDPESDALTYTATSSDIAVATVSVSESTVSLTAVAAGTATLTVTATDPGGLSVDQTLSVSVNRYPVTVGTIPDQTLGVRGGSVTLDVSGYFSDPDGDTLTYSALTTGTFVTLSVSNAMLTITPVATGLRSVSVSATDPGGLSVTNTFSVRVVLNLAPVTLGTISDQTLQLDETFTVDPHTYFSDPEGDTLSFEYGAVDVVMTNVEIATKIVTYTPVEAGTASLYIQATDPGALSVTLTFSITVEGTPNQAPETVGTIPDQTVDIGSDDLSLDVSSYFSDPDGDPLSYAFAFSDSSKMNASVTGSTVLFTGVAAGTVTVTVTATDTGALTATQTFTLTVVQPNRAPVKTQKNFSDGHISSSGSAATVESVSSYFSDPDGDTLTYTAASSDTTVATVSVSGDTLNISRAMVTSSGTVTISVTATDPGDLSLTRTFSMTVEAMSDTPGPAPADAIPSFSSKERLALESLLTFDTVIFNEFYNDTNGASDWLELRNVSAADLSLDAWHLNILTSDGSVAVDFPAGTMIPAGEVLLLVNTASATTKASLSSVVVEAFVLPGTEFALLLQGPEGLSDLASNTFADEMGTAWYRIQPTVSGYGAQAWSKSTTQDGVGTPGYRHASETADLNNDGVVNILDLVLVASQFGTTDTSAADLNNDGVINIQDLVVVANALNDIVR